MREVVCLLDVGDLASYRSPLLRRYERELRVTHVPVDEGALPGPDALQRALVALRRAETGGGPVVVHSAAGVGRTGLLSAAWLRARYGLAPEAAVALVRDHARHFGAQRDPLEAGADALPFLASVEALA
jgi:atypical dual specificity phosphatase